MLWRLPEQFPVLRSNQVHVWRASLMREAEEVMALRELLNSAEKERADKFIVKHAANNFIIARGILRKLLAQYLQVLPQELVFEQNQYGKLYLASSPIQFNLSHSHGLALFSFALNMPVGVDVELIRDDYEFHDIASKFFSPIEARELLALPKERQVAAFFNCWTCKEAFIKARGIGMFAALDEFSVEITDRKEGRRKLEYAKVSDGHTWMLESLDPTEQYAGALAVGFTESTVATYDLRLFDVLNHEI